MIREVNPEISLQKKIIRYDNDYCKETTIWKFSYIVDEISHSIWISGNNSDYTIKVRIPNKDQDQNIHNYIAPCLVSRVYTPYGIHTKFHHEIKRLNDIAEMNIESIK